MTKEQCFGTLIGLLLIALLLGACVAAEAPPPAPTTPAQSTSTPISPTPTVQRATPTTVVLTATPEPSATSFPEVSALPLSWPLAMPTGQQVQEARACDIEALADERYSSVATDELRESHQVATPCDWAALAAAYALRAEADEFALEAGQLAWANAASQNPAYAFAHGLFLVYLEAADALAPPPFIYEPLVHVTMRYDWTGLGSDPVEYSISIENADTAPEVVGNLEGRDYASTLDEDLVRALGRSLKGLIPVDAAADSRALIVCTDNYPDWEAVLTYRSGETVKMATHGSNVYDFGGPWWVTVDDRLYLQPSPVFAIAIYDIVSALELPVGVAAGTYCRGLESELLDIMYPDYRASQPATELPTPSAGAWTRPKDGAAMVFVPAGEFLMGTSDDEIEAILVECDTCRREWFAMEQPQHTAYLEAFWIDQTEVTNAQFQKCVEAKACREPWCWDGLYAPDQPVVCVQWTHAQEYATWVGGRLPTEAEWEKAARGTDGRTYPWGSDAPDCDVANYGNCVGRRPSAVGSYPDGASPYGALDMAGNVQEWVADWYAEGYYASSPQRNPHGPEQGDRRMLRGGTYSSTDLHIRCASRDWYAEGFLDHDIGFRVVVDPRSVSE